MPEFSEKSKALLHTCNKDIVTIFEWVIKYFDCTVICGHRGEAEQNKAFSEGCSKLKFPKSKHNQIPSNAIDVAPYPIDFKDKERIIYFAGQVMGIATLLKERGIIDHNIKWGGDWDRDTNLKNNKFADLVHFEII